MGKYQQIKQTFCLRNKKEKIWRYYIIFCKSFFILFSYSVYEIHFQWIIAQNLGHIRQDIPNYEFFNKPNSKIVKVWIISIENRIYIRGEIKESLGMSFFSPFKPEREFEFKVYNSCKCSQIICSRVH